MLNVNIGAMNEINTPRNFLCTINAEGEYLFYSLKASEIEQANFLDIHNLKLEAVLPERIPVRDFVPPAQAWPLRYIFHTAFCGSTLLSRALNQTPRDLVLKEPDVLMKISSQSLLVGNENISPFLLASLKELSRPWAPSGSVIIKPSNSVNRLILEILGHYPGRAILLYSSLEEFLVSCFKKLPHAEQKIRWMAQHLIHHTELQKKLNVGSNHPFGFIESCVIAWYSQMEYFAKAIERDTNDQIRMLEMKDMLAKPFEAVHAASQFFGLDRTLTELEASVSREFSRNSKNLDKAYTDTDRSLEANRVKIEYSSVLAEALKWAEANIAPVAIMPGQCKSLI